jgi:hypothetical protein
MPLIGFGKRHRPPKQDVKTKGGKPFIGRWGSRKSNLTGQNMVGNHLLGRNILILDAAVDEVGQLVGRLLDVGSILGDGELLEKLVKNLDGLSVLGRHVVGGEDERYRFERSVRDKDCGENSVASFEYPNLLMSSRELADTMEESNLLYRGFFTCRRGGVISDGVETRRKW